MCVDVEVYSLYFPSSWREWETGENNNVLKYWFFVWFHFQNGGDGVSSSEEDEFPNHKGNFLFMSSTLHKSWWQNLRKVLTQVYGVMCSVVWGGVDCHIYVCFLCPMLMFEGESVVRCGQCQCVPSVECPSICILIDTFTHFILSLCSVQSNLFIHGMSRYYQSTYKVEAVL